MAILDKSILSPSTGGVAANKSGLNESLNSLATNRLRYFGVMLSPLLMSIHRTSTGRFAVMSKHFCIGTFRYTPMLRKYAISSLRADLTNPESSLSPDTSSSATISVSCRASAGHSNADRPSSMSSYADSATIFISSASSSDNDLVVA